MKFHMISTSQQQNNYMKTFLCVWQKLDVSGVGLD